MEKVSQSGERPSESHQIHLIVIDRAFTTVWLLIRCGFWIAIAYIIYLGIKELAGQTTIASFFLSYLAGDSNSSGSSSFIWMFLTLLFFIWAKFERWLRHRKVALMSDRVTKLELQINPSRTTSGLMITGETPVEERLP